MPLQETSGAASYDAFGGGAAAVPQYIEDVFSTYLYTGTGASQTITNGIDLSTKGGLVWQKDRSQGTGYHHILQDTARGATNVLFTNLTNAQSQDSSGTGFVFNNNGFTIGSTNVKVNASGDNYASWTFRKQPKFFDIVTYTGNGANRTISHSLGATPGCIIVKRTDTTGGWVTYHRSIGNTSVLFLDTTAPADSDPSYWNNTSPTSTNFSVGTFTGVNANAGTYVAYLFAHDAGGFGLTGTDNVISCGTYAGNGSGSGSNTINLGYEPQYLLVKRSLGGVGSWWVIDNMRGATADGNDALLAANTTAAEVADQKIAFTATGFTLYDSSSEFNASGSNYIYIAIRRGPMKVPTSGTSVFGLSARTGTGANATVTGGQTDDAVLVKNRGSAVASLFSSRLTGTRYLVTSSTAAEVAAGVTILQANPWDVMDGVKVGTTSTITNASSNTFINYLFKRAPSFFDVVCYTGTGVARTINHNLGVAPELMIVRSRSAAANWEVYAAPLGATKYLRLDLTSAVATYSDFWNDTAPTASVFTVATDADVNGSGRTQVAYLFATCAGVSKVDSYTGTGALQTVNCGFTSGARFVLIKRTDSTGDWWTYDSARGISSGNDPYLFLNSTAAEVTSTNYVDTDTTGFKVTAAAPAGLNASGGTYIFLAIA